MAKSSIEWTETTWNPVTGCTKVSPGCKHCYAERMANRLRAMGHPNYRNGFELTLHEHVIDAPHSWRKPQLVFVNSMSDLFHDEVPIAFLRRVFDVMLVTPRHRYQILTKRAERLAEVAGRLDWPPNVWMGVSVERADYTSRIRALRSTPAAVKFLSLEPLLGPLPGLDLREIDWVIAGGESCPRARPMDPAWVRGIRDQCVAAGVAFFFKQWGGVRKDRTGRELDGRTWDEMPAAAGRARV